MVMPYLDQQVVAQALDWLHSGEPVWLCTVLSTFGSSPREPGAMMTARINTTQRTEHLGSLSGGCVEEDFLERLFDGEFTQPATVLTYGAGAQAHASATNTNATNASAGTEAKVQLPCGGTLVVLVEHWQPDNPHTLAHAQAMLACLSGSHQAIREVCLDAARPPTLTPIPDTQSTPDTHLTPLLTMDTHRCITPPPAMVGRVQQLDQLIRLHIGPSSRLIIAGLSSVAHCCAEFAVALGYEVIVCEPREEERLGFQLPGVILDTRMPSAFIRQAGQCHAATAVVAMTHDPRIDDLAMMAAVKTPAFYIGVMGSRRTSDARAARLMRSGGLSSQQVERLHMPIGLALGSKTPAEIALAVMADVVRVQKGQSRDQL
ncbi:XdhC family protein [Oceanobacter sp. 4_MG-2023]|uniref:XdhC family protein n=1 Tax=Oceanobacter sp. 4_MG-2023 TaxID=3062623 RepID=UPI00351F25E7